MPGIREAGSYRQVHRQSIWTRLTHWTWAIALFFLLLSGLHIFNSHPVLYLGEQSGFAFDSAVLRIGAEKVGDDVRGYTELLGRRADTTGVLGVSDSGRRAFPSWATTPSYHALETGRLIHFFFGWLLVGTLGLWFAASLLNGHLWRDVLPSRADLRDLPRECADHARLRIGNSARYNGLQRLSYTLLMFGALPLMVATGLAMSPAMGALIPGLTDMFAGRETARTIHFIGAAALVLFVVVHVLMVLAHRPVDAMRGMVTGWRRSDADPAGRS